MQVITKRPNGTIRVQTINNEKDMCQQQYKDSCDVNNIMKKYETTGELFHTQKAEGRYAQLGDPVDLMEAHNRVETAERAFMALPAEIRHKCDHDYIKFVEMVQKGEDPDLVKHGIIKAKPEKKSDEGGVKPSPKASV